MNDRPDHFSVGDVPIRSAGLETHVLDEQCVVYDMKSHHVHYLNATAALILELCDSMNSVAEIVGLVQEAYSLERAPRSEVVQCLQDFEQKGLITSASSAMAKD